MKNTPDLQKTLDQGIYKQSTSWTSSEGSKIYVKREYPELLFTSILLGVVMGLALLTLGK